MRRSRSPLNVKHVAAERLRKELADIEASAPRRIKGETTGIAPIAIEAVKIPLRGKLFL